MPRLVRILVLFILLQAVERVTVLAASPDNNPPAGFRMTVNLRDGSKLVGFYPGTEMKLIANGVGELTLPLERVHAIDNQTGTNLARVVLANGDVLMARLGMPEIDLQTSFGEVKLPLEIIKDVRISTLRKSGRPTDGLIGLWSGEGDGVDSVHGNNGVLQNVNFTDGVVGKAFSFGQNSAYSCVQIADKPEYQLLSMTIEAWLRPRADGWVIFFRGDHRPGLDPYTVATTPDHTVSFGISDNNGNTISVGAPIAYNEWTHVAATLDDATGAMCIYTNGLLASRTETKLRPILALDPTQTPGVGIGNENDGGNNFQFHGDVDEVGLYNRALSAAEINNIYMENEANAGSRAETLPSSPQPPLNVFP